MSLINLIEFKTLGDDRGSLISLEQNKNIPFEIKRIYYIFGTKENVSRGFHAHKNLEQVAICLSGSCRFILDNGKRRKKSLLTPLLKDYILITISGGKCMISHQIVFWLYWPASIIWNQITLEIMMISFIV